MKLSVSYYCTMITFLTMILIISTCGSQSETHSDGLKDIFKDHYRIGTALNNNQVFGNEPSAMTLVKKHFNSITPENTLKWEVVHPEPDKYIFTPVDRLIETGKKLNMFIVGHTLVWNNQTPAWVFEDEDGKPTDRETLLNRMRDHIFTVVGRYKGSIQGWDVVNEAIDDNGEYLKNRWYNIIGKDYVQKAFEFAHEADPDVELYYNDFNMWKSGKRDGVVKLISDLQAKGVRVDGIGMQGHWGLDYPDLQETETAIAAYAKLGVQVLITEMDVSVLPFPFDYIGADITKNFELQKKLNPYPDSLPDSVQTILAERYAEYFTIFNKFSDTISRITLWGVHDGNSWKNNWPVKGRTDYPLLFDRHYQPKPAFHAVVKTVRHD